MFGLGDDFDLDDNFLDEVLQVEAACTSESNYNRSQKVSQKFDTTHLNILKEPLQSETETEATGCTFNISNDLTGRESRNFLSCTTSVGEHLNGGKESSARKVRARKFPGPAGLLPQRQANTSLIATEDFLNELEEEFREESKFKDEEVLSQESALRLESPAWAELVKDLGANGRALLNQLNVASVCSKAKQSRVLKVPFLALHIQNVDASTSDPCLYLSDPTGEMVGAVHREVWEQVGEDLVVGSVLVLINVSVLCAGLTSSRPYLNITSNNVAAIYSSTDESDVRVTYMKPISQVDCSKYLQTWKRLLSTPPQLSVQPPLEPSQPLFTTASLSSSSQSHKYPSFPNRMTTPTVNRSFDLSFNSPSANSPLRNNPIDFNSSSNRPFNNFSPVSRPLNHRSPQNQPLRHHPYNNKSNANPQFQSVSNCPANSIKFHSASQNPQFRASNRLPSPVASSQASESQSVVASLLDGIDPDSLFGDF